MAHGKVNDYTPTTHIVRERYWLATTSDAELSSRYADSQRAEFDRWLAAEKAEAWDEGYKAGRRDGREEEQRIQHIQMRDRWEPEIPPTPNPYRSEP